MMRWETFSVFWNIDHISVDMDADEDDGDVNGVEGTR